MHIGQPVEKGPLGSTPELPTRNVGALPTATESTKPGAINRASTPTARTRRTWTPAAPVLRRSSLAAFATPPTR